MPSSASFDSVESAIADIAAGRMVIVTDDEDRENEGDLVMAAAKATPETVNMMIRHARGLLCVPTTGEQLRRLNITMMVQENRESHRTAFTVSVDAAAGIGTGISAADRARTALVLANPGSLPGDLVQPGHIFPLAARPGGVLERAGHTEAAVDLALLAGQPPSGLICEILNEDGSLARLPELLEFKQRFGLKLISIAALIEFRHRRDNLVERISVRPFPSEFGDFTLHVFKSKVDGRHHLAFTMGTVSSDPTLVRVHGENLLSDVFRALCMDSHRSLISSLQRIATEGRGVLLYMEQSDGARDSLWRLDPPAPSGDSSKTSCTVPMDFRDYGIGAQILVALGLKKIRLLSGTNRKVIGLDGYGIEIVEQIAL